MTVTADSASYRDARPMLSVLIPFLRDDPCALLESIDQEAGVVAGGVEVCVLDDGTCDDDLTQRIGALVKAMALPVRFVSLAQNEGRAKGRNRLFSMARGGTLLFLDADMRPDSPTFLQTWVDLVRQQAPAVAFGGFTVDKAPLDPQFAVHRCLAATTECLPAAVRSRQPEKHVFTSNLLVRRDVFEAERFDAGFTGWGWEDVEWGIRVSQSFPVIHVDNTATHMGLEPPEKLLAKFKQSARNFARLATRYPEQVSNYPGYRLAMLLKRMPFAGAFRSVCEAMTRSPRLPVRLRVIALRLYRASHYAEAL